MGDHHVVRGHPTRFGKYWLWPVWLCGYQAYLAVVAGVDMAGVVVAGVGFWPVWLCGYLARLLRLWQTIYNYQKRKI